MGGGGAWLVWLLGAGWSVYMLALAWGKTPVGRVRDERDALYSRWFFGGLTVVGGLALAVTSTSLPAWAVAAGLVFSGAAVINSATHLAPTDPTNRVPDLEIRRATRQFVFDSRPPARGAIDIHPKRGWSVFVAAAMVGFTGLLVVGIIDTLGGGEGDRFVSLLIWLGMGAFFIIFLIAPSVWWVQRVVRGIPFLRIDERGLVMGRDARRDAAITWDEVGSVEVRVVTSNGMTDRLVLIHPTRSDWNDRQPWVWRIYGRMSRAMYGSHFAISTMTLSVPIEEVLARIAAHRPSAIAPESTAGVAGIP